MPIRVMKRLVRRSLEHTLVRRALERTSAGSRFLLRREYGVNGPCGYPDAPWSCAVLKYAKEVQESFEQVKRLELPPVPDLPKKLGLPGSARFDSPNNEYEISYI